MDLSRAVAIFMATRTLTVEGVTVPGDLVILNMEATEVLMSGGYIEPYICSHGHAKLRATEKFAGMVR